MNVSNHRIWGSLQDSLRDLILEGVERGWMSARSWDDLQRGIANQFKQQLAPSIVRENVPLSVLGVAGSSAQIDIVLGNLAEKGLGGFLIHISGHTLPRHEKELLEIMAVSLADARFAYGVLVVCSDNQLRLEGRATSFAYCSGPLIRLAAPILGRCNLLGLLVVGLPTPPYTPGASLTPHQRA